MKEIQETMKKEQDGKGAHGSPGPARQNPKLNNDNSMLYMNLFLIGIMLAVFGFTFWCCCSSSRKNNGDFEEKDLTEIQKEFTEQHLK